MDLLTGPMAIFDFALTKVLPFIFVLSIVVFFHELGHFLVARWNHVKVEAFAVGFGREIFGFKDKRGTRWKLCIIPLGGYVKFLGDADGSSRTDHEALAQMSPDEREGSFESKALWRRAAVVAAGPMANFILASVIYTALFMYFGDAKLAPIVGKVLEQSAAESAGFQVDDRILTIEGTRIESFDDIASYTMVSSDRPLKFVVERGGKEVSLLTTPRMTDRKDQFGNDFQVGMVGIQPNIDQENIVLIQLGPVAAFTKSLKSIGEIASRTYHVIRELITGKRDATQLRGPLGIAQMASQVATLGLLQLISLTAALSVSIGLMNLLPLPVLDGGHLVFYAIEAVRGKALHPQTQEYAFRFGLACLLMLMVFVTFFDGSRIKDAWMG